MKAAATFVSLLLHLNLFLTGRDLGFANASKPTMGASPSTPATTTTTTASNFVGTGSPSTSQSSVSSSPNEEDESLSTTSLPSSSQSTQPQAQQAAVVPKQQQRRHHTSSYDLHLHRDPIYMWSSLVAGAGSGALASILCAPLDLIRTRLQVWSDVMVGTGVKRGGLATIPVMLREIVAKEGVRGCFRGLGATLMTVPAFWGVYFPLYDDLKRHWRIQYPNTSQAWIHCGSAVMAGAVSDVLCNPMFVVRTRLQTEALHNLAESSSQTVMRPKSVIETAKALYKEGGILIFWRGMSANLMGLSHVAVQFPVYEALKKQLRHHRQRQQQQQTSNPPKRHNSALDLLAASALSKMTACIMTYPHEVIRSRMMDARTGVGFVETCRRIHAAEGFMGFYAGLPVTLLRVLPNTCITFLTYELLLQFARRQIEERRDRKAAAAMTAAARR